MKFLQSILLSLLIGLCSNLVFAQSDANPNGSSNVTSSPSYSSNSGHQIWDWHRLFTGGSLGASFGNSDIYFEISPLLGYKVTDMMRVGAGFNYQYFNNGVSNIFDIPYKLSLIGFNAFVEHDIAFGILAHVNYENLKATLISDDPLITDVEGWYPSLLLGGGYRVPIGENSASQILLLHPVSLDSPNSIYSSPLAVRFAIHIGF
jgi:hypothetical protein